MPIIDIDPSTGQRRVAFSRDAGMAQPRKKKPWNKARAARYRNDTVKFSHLDRPLSGPQKGKISALAAKAFQLNKVQGWTLDEWRVAQAEECCRYRIKDAPAKMYPKLMAHFEALCGNIDKSQQYAARASVGAQRHASLMFLISKELCKLPRLSHDDTEAPPKGTPRQSAWAWADAIATRKFGVPCRSVDVNALGSLHTLIKHEVSNERKTEKLLNKQAAAQRKAAKGQGIKMPRPKAAKAPKVKGIKPVMCACKKCGHDKPVATDGTGSLSPAIQCPECEFQICGDDFGKVLAAWNKGGVAV